MSDLAAPFQRPRTNIQDEFCDQCFDFFAFNSVVARLGQSRRLAELPSEWRERGNASCKYDLSDCSGFLTSGTWCKLHQMLSESPAIKLGRWHELEDPLEIKYVLSQGRETVDIQKIQISGRTFSETLLLMDASVCAYTDDPASVTVASRPTIEDLWTTDQVEKVLVWLRSCQTDHTHGKYSQMTLPSRLLDVRPKGHAYMADKVILHKTSTIDKQIQYATLSYCWGGPQALTLTSASYEDLNAGIPTHSLAPTVQDAIQITKDIGLRYLWIDSLCIIQDDEDDKAREIAAMASIYKGAVITISATNAKSASEGFLKARNDIMYEKEWFRLPFGRNGEVYAHDRLPPSIHIVAQEPLRRRGWALQEGLLSRRLLTFGSYNLHFGCKAYKFTDERGIARVDVSPGQSGSIHEPLRSHRQWLTIVQNYTERDLSERRDKLPGISAIAQQFSQKYDDFAGVKYAAGLWLAYMSEGLLWTIANPVSSSTKLPYRAPSWSWAAPDAQIEFVSLTMPLRYISAIDVLECEVQLAKEGAPFGEVTGGFLALRGLLSKDFVSPRIRSEPTWSSLVPLGDGIIFDDTERKPSLASMHFLHVYIWREEGRVRGSMGLALQHAGNNSFRRAGFFRISASDEADKVNVGIRQWLDGAVKSKLTII